MDETLFNTLIRKSESDTLDFKAQQYSFVGGSDEAKGELLKDILAFANAWKETDAYILVGVKEKNQRADGLASITSHLADNDLQEFINKKTNRPVVFSVEAVGFEGIDLDVICINRSQARPIFLKKNFGRLTRGEVYIRRGSATAVADPDEIAEMGKTSASASLLPTFEMFAFSKCEDSNKTGFIGRVRLQLNNSGTRSARNLSATIKHDETGCLAGGASVDWEQPASETRLNPRTLHYRHSLNPKKSTVIMEILLCERSPFPFNISVEISVDDCPPVIFRGEISAEQVAGEQHVPFEKES